MMQKQFRIESEPRGASYKALVRNVAEFASHFLVVVRDDLGLTSEARQLLAKLAALGSSELRASHWPGTRLLGDEASVWLTAATEESVDVLLEATDGLYDWQQPEFPEDLAFLRSDGSPVLGTVAHEGDAWLVLSDDEYSSVVASCGALLDLVQESDASDASAPPDDCAT